MKIAFLRHASGRGSGAVETCIIAGELRFDTEEIEEILVDQFGELGVLLASRVADYREHAVDHGIEKTFAQDSLPDHPRRSEENGFHGVISASGEWMMRGHESNSSSDVATCSLATGSVCAK